MMKPLFLLSVLAVSIATNAQNFRRTFGWGSYNTAPAFVQTPDSGFALLGSFSSATSFQTDFVLMRADTAGVFQWAKAYGGNGVDEARDIIQLADSGWLLVGFSNSFSPNNDYDGYLVRLNSSGDTVWTKTIGTAAWDFFYDVEVSSSGNFMLSGATNGSTNGRTAGWLVEISPSGNVINQYRFESGLSNYFLRATIDANGDIFFAGYNENPNSLEKHGLVVKYDAITLDTVWTFAYQTTDEDVIYDIKLLPNGNIAICGVRQLNGTTNDDNLIAVLQPNGSLLWQESVNLPGSSSYNKLQILGDTLIAGGYTSDFGEGGKDMLVNWFNSAGTFIKGNTLGYTQDELLYDFDLTNDNQFILFGTTTSYGPGLQSMLLARTDTAFSLGTNIVIGINEQEKNNSLVTVFPNPVNNLLTIRKPVDIGTLEYSLFNVTGEQLVTGEIVTAEYTLPIANLPTGVYMLIVKNNTNLISRYRIIIEH